MTAYLARGVSTTGSWANTVPTSPRHIRENSTGIELRDARLLPVIVLLFSLGVSLRPNDAGEPPPVGKPQTESGRRSRHRRGLGAYFLLRVKRESVCKIPEVLICSVFVNGKEDFVFRKRRKLKPGAKKARPYRGRAHNESTVLATVRTNSEIKGVVLEGELVIHRCTCRRTELVLEA